MISEIIMNLTIIIINPISEQLDDKQFAETETMMLSVMSSVMSSTTVIMNPTLEKLNGKVWYYVCTAIIKLLK